MSQNYQQYNSNPYGQAEAGYGASNPYGDNTGYGQSQNSNPYGGGDGGYGGGGVSHCDRARNRLLLTQL
jgi:hypothetical protein